MESTQPLATGERAAIKRNVRNVESLRRCDTPALVERWNLGRDQSRAQAVSGGTWGFPALSVQRSGMTTPTNSFAVSSAVTTAAPVPLYCTWIRFAPRISTAFRMSARYAGLYCAGSPDASTGTTRRYGGNTPSTALNTATPKPPVARYSPVSLGPSITIGCFNAALEIFMLSTVARGMMNCVPGVTPPFSAATRTTDSRCPSVAITRVSFSKTSMQIPLR
ncbi:hypothetical protein BCO18430_02969 [Burkholderia contaminans]|nr:hypothetical protein BCO18430_02969 [Burkholderia contaminans]